VTGETDSSDQDISNQEMSELEPLMVTLSFETDQPDELLSVLAHYVVMSRNADGNRNIDLVASMTRPGRLLIIEKWDSAAHQQTHFDSEVMVDMARACDGLLTSAPDIDLYEAVTMHDLD
jgi:quinol monooxygenase YgiN